MFLASITDLDKFVSEQEENFKSQETPKINVEINLL